MKTLTLTEAQSLSLGHHLFPPDGCEAVAFLLCGRRRGEYAERLLVQQVMSIPYGECSERTPTTVRWSAARLASLSTVPEFANNAND